VKKIQLLGLLCSLVLGCGNSDIWNSLNEKTGSSKEFVSFRIASPLSYGVIDEVTKTVFITVPFGTSLSNLVATFNSTGENVSVGGNIQTSGETANDFSHTVIYTVGAYDGSTADYSVTVNVASTDAKEITYFEVAGVAGTIHGASISVVVPSGTDITNIVPVFMHTGSSVSPGAGIPVDFTSPVSYSVKAYDGTSKTYSVHVLIASDTSKEIKSFIVLGNPCYINGDSIVITVPFGTSVASLIPTIAISGISVNPASGVAADFTSPVTYTVTAANGSTRNYTVTAVVASVSESNDSSLMSITVSKGVLQPAFSSTVFSYLDAPIPFSDSANPAYNDSQSVMINVVPSYEGARIQFNGGVPFVREGAYLRKNLDVGSTDLTITVTAIDGTTSTYTVKMYRAIPVFKTGQTILYTSGDDGGTKRGVSWPNPRFVVSGEGSCVIDLMTGLEWTKTVGIFGDVESWSNLASHDGASLYTMDGWRLANIRELLSIRSYGYTSTNWLTSSGFSILYTDLWSSTSYNTTDAWLLSISSGSMTVVPAGKSHPSSEYGLWMVRRKSSCIPETGQVTEFLPGDNGYHRLDSGVFFPSPRFHKNGDGTITDNLTGLTWHQNAVFKSEFSFSAALTDINNLNSASGGDWRLPNVNEIMSILDYSTEEPNVWLGTGLFTTWAGRYWSSTTDPADTANAFILNMTDGSLTTVKKESPPSSCVIWPVRDARNAAH